MIQRITSLTEPPALGRFYLVPTVEHPWLKAKKPKPWPVFMTKHEDAEHLNFPDLHYHVDPRFLTEAEFTWAASYTVFVDAFGVCQTYPLNWRDNRGAKPLPPVVWKKRRCARVDVPYRFAHEISRSLGPAFVGRQCKRARTGWVCPHKHVPLGSFVPVDGVITCPLHGLQVDAESGVVVGPAQRTHRIAA